jgi:hypothetical protein
MSDEKVNLKPKDPWGRCYDHNFQRFLPIFGEKIGVFLKNQCYDHNFQRFLPIFGKKSAFFSKTNVMITIFAKTSSSLSKKRQYFR